jgi:class 3 adenylate cyclase
MAPLIPGARLIEYPEAYYMPWMGDTGQRDSAAIDPDRILATVLFTDIAGLTERAVQLGDQRWRDLLNQHDQLARQMVEQHRGALVKSTGDGVLATFDSPGRAVRCALAFASAAADIGLPLRGDSIPGRSRDGAETSAASRYIRPRG